MRVSTGAPRGGPGRAPRRSHDQRACPAVSPESPLPRRPPLSGGRDRPAGLGRPPDRPRRLHRLRRLRPHVLHFRPKREKLVAYLDGGQTNAYFIYRQTAAQGGHPLAKLSRWLADYLPRWFVGHMARARHPGVLEPGVPVRSPPCSGSACHQARRRLTPSGLTFSWPSGLLPSRPGVRAPTPRASPRGQRARARGWPS